MTPMTPMTRMLPSSLLGLAAVLALCATPGFADKASYNAPENTPVDAPIGAPVGARTAFIPAGSATSADGPGLDFGLSGRGPAAPLPRPGAGSGPVLAFPPGSGPGPEPALRAQASAPLGFAIEAGRRPEQALPRPGASDFPMPAATPFAVHPGRFRDADFLDARRAGGAARVDRRLSFAALPGRPASGAGKTSAALHATMSTKSVGPEVLGPPRPRNPDLLEVAQPIGDLRADAARLGARAPRSLRGETELGCLAVAIYHEARNQSPRGQLAVASVIEQRARVPGRWGDTICEVVRPVQFSFMRSRRRFPAIREPRAWRRSIDMALKSILAGPMPELRKADHYHATYVHPGWRHGMVRIGRIGSHVFYRDPRS